VIRVSPCSSHRNGAVSLAVRTMVTGPLCNADGWGVPSLVGSAPGEGRGENWGVDLTAGNSPTRFSFEPFGCLDLDFLAKYFGGN